MKRFIVNFAKNTVVLTVMLIAAILFFGFMFATMVYGVVAVGILETNGHMHLAYGFALITILLMLLEFYFMHRACDWFQDTDFLN